MWCFQEVFVFVLGFVRFLFFVFCFCPVFHHASQNVDVMAGAISVILGHEDKNHSQG